MAVRVPAGQTLHGSTYNPVTGVITYFGTGGTVGGTYNPATGVSTALGGGFSGGAAGLSPEQRDALVRAQAAATAARLQAERTNLQSDIDTFKAKQAEVSRIVIALRQQPTAFRDGGAEGMKEHRDWFIFFGSLLICVGCLVQAATATTTVQAQPVDKAFIASHFTPMQRAMLCDYLKQKGFTELRTLEPYCGDV